MERGMICRPKERKVSYYPCVKRRCPNKKRPCPYALIKVPIHVFSSIIPQSSNYIKKRLWLGLYALVDPPIAPINHLKLDPQAQICYVHRKWIICAHYDTMFSMHLNLPSRHLEWILYSGSKGISSIGIYTVIIYKSYTGGGYAQTNTWVPFWAE